MKIHYKMVRVLLYKTGFIQESYKSENYTNYIHKL